MGKFFEFCSGDVDAHAGIGAAIGFFQELNRRIEERWNAGNLSHGFWRSGVIQKLTPVDILRVDTGLSTSAKEAMR
jgi:hypothetical protein